MSKYLSAAKRVADYVVDHPGTTLQHIKDNCRKTYEGDSHSATHIERQSIPAALKRGWIREVPCWKECGCSGGSTRYNRVWHASGPHYFPTELG